MEGVGFNPKLPPHNQEAERSVLGGILVSSNGLYKALEVHLSAENFYRKAHQKIFQGILDLEKKAEPIDPLTLADLLKDRGELEKIGGSAFLNQLAADEFTSSHIGKYAKIVRDKAILRDVMQACTDIITTATDGVEDVSAFLDEAQSSIFKIAAVSDRGDFQPITNILKEAFLKIESLYQNDSEVSGLSTGFRELDKLLSGLQNGALYIIAARPAMGKTALALNLAANIAIKEKKTVAIFSLEMPNVELVNRLLSSEAWIDAEKVKTGKVTDRDWKKLQRAANTLTKTKMFIDDTSSITILEMRSKARRLKAKHGLSVMFVDYLQLMSGGARSGYENRERIISDISRGLKSLAKELNIPIVALSQLNRGVETRPDKRPGLADIRESGAIEQDADVVAFIYRDHVYNKEANPHDSELIVAKHRAGRTSNIPLTWLEDYTTFKDHGDEEDPSNYGGTPPAHHYPDDPPFSIVSFYM